MKPREVVMGVVAVLAAAGCIRLGIWQLHRLDERRAKNRLIIMQTAAPFASVADARMQDTSKLHWRRMKVRGVPDYKREIALAARSQNGSVGVQVVTPIKPVDDSWPDTSILVIRGFMPAPDGRTYARASTSEGDTLDIEGLVTEFPLPLNGTVRMPSLNYAFRWLDRDTLAKETATRLAPFVLLQLGDTVQHDVSKITRVPPPSLSEGPHKSYAVQWFVFATIALVGFVAYLVNQRSKVVSQNSNIG